MVFLLKIPIFGIFLDLNNMKIVKNNVQLGGIFGKRWKMELEISLHVENGRWPPL